MFEHKYIKFLDYVIEKNGSFHLQPAFDASGLTKEEFLLIKDFFVYNDNLPDSHEPASQSLNWKLKPEAVFGYLNYKQYEHAIHSAKWALWIATASLAAGMIGAIWEIFV
jgi:hypothetical protein